MVYLARSAQVLWAFYLCYGILRYEYFEKLQVSSLKCCTYRVIMNG